LKIYNFRTRGGLKVDFILGLDRDRIAIECKSGNQVSSTDYRNLLALENYYPKIKKIVVYNGKVEKKENGVWILPLPKTLEVLGLI